MDKFNNSGIWSLNLREFREKIASSEPTPGGGSVTVVSASFGLALVIMAMEITLKKPSEELTALTDKTKAVLHKLSSYADEDIEVFESYMRAFKLPKNNESEVAFKKRELSSSVVAATESPLNAASYIIQSMQLAKEAIPLTKRSVISDIGAGVSLLLGALNGLLLNVDVNLPNIENSDLRERIQVKRNRLRDEGVNLSRTILDEVNKIIA